MLAAGRSILSPMIALVGTGLYAGSVIGVDIATNARGYPIVIVAMLILIGLLPALRDREAGRCYRCGCRTGAIGFYACPVMAYPDRVCVCQLAAHGSCKGDTTCWSMCLVCFALGLPHSYWSRCLYAPAWALSSWQRARMRTLGRAATGV